MNIHTNIKEIIKKYGRGIINLIIAVGVSFILSARSLYFSTGQFGIEMFKSYFANVYTIILNTAPILFVILILLVIVNRLWISVGIASILVIVLSLINYFKLSFRDDPLLVEDLSLFFEMRNMTERYKIHISSSKKVNIIAIMMEAYGDFSVYPQIEFDSENNPYAAFNRIKEISYHGNLLTDIFAAGTVRTERRFITGADAYPSLRRITDDSENVCIHVDNRHGASTFILVSKRRNICCGRIPYYFALSASITDWICFISVS